MRRRIPGLLLVVLAIVGIAVFGRDTPDRATAEFSISAQGWMPSAPSAGALTETWFCPGVPATGVDGVEGEIVVANRGDSLLDGTVLVMNDEGESRNLTLSVEAWTSATLDLDEVLPANIVGAVVEIEGGGALVEQHSLDPDGDSVAACPTATSDHWYLADGFTVDGSLNQVILANPFEQTVVANLSFATREGYREPGSYRGLTVAPRSIRVIDLGAPGAGAQSEPVLAVDVEVARGRLVVGRAQKFVGGGRSGTQVTVASPTPREQWWFASGEKGPGIREEFVIYNPTSSSVEVDVLFIGIDTPVLVDPIFVPAREAVVFNSGSQSLLPDGTHSTVFATSTNDSSIVVERVVTRTADDVTGTGVLAGATARQDGYVATTWYVTSAPAEPTEDALVVYNVDNSPGSISVFAVGRSGPVPVESMQGIEYGPARQISLDLTDPLVVGRQLVIEATTRVMIERSFPSGVGDLRTPSWAIPLG
jgi:hypothetical protein